MKNDSPGTIFLPSIPNGPTPAVSGEIWLGRLCDGDEITHPAAQIHKPLAYQPKMSETQRIQLSSYRVVQNRLIPTGKPVPTDHTLDGEVLGTDYYEGVRELFPRGQPQ